MSGPAAGGFDFNLMQQMNAGGQKDKGAYPGAFPLLKGLGEASIGAATGIGSISGKVEGDGANVNPLAGAGQKGLLDMLGAGTEHRKGPIAAMVSAIFPKEAFRQYADGSSDNSSGGGGGGESGSNHPFSAVGSAVGSGFDGVAQDASFAPGQAISPSASPSVGAGQGMGMGA